MNLKKSVLMLSILGFGLAAVVLPLLSSAADAAPVQITINPNLPGTNPSTTPGGWVASFYQFALLLAGVLAFGAIVYGGFMYATAQGNPGRESDGKSWIYSALLGLLLLAGAYIILYTINPNILNLNLPALPQLQGGTPAAGVPGGVSNSAAFKVLQDAGVNVAAPISIEGIQLSTIAALKDLKNQCGSAPVTVTSVTGGTHSTTGGCTHANGYKADIRPNGALDACITGSSGSGFQQISPRSGDGAPQYLAPDGAIYADERTKPPNCGGSNPASCDWTGSHWDMQSCGVTGS